MPDTPAAVSSGKSLLDRFPAGVRQRLDVVDEHHDLREILFRPDELPRWAHFPHYGTVVSLTRSTEEGTTVEVGRGVGRRRRGPESAPAAALRL